MEGCLKETLRLRPPIMTMMRMARSPQVRAPPSSTGVPRRKYTLGRFTHTSDVIANPPRRRPVTPSQSATKSASPRPSTTAWGTPGTRGWTSSPTATSTTIQPQGRSLPTYHLELVRGGKKASFKCFYARIWRGVPVAVVALRPPPLHRGELCLRPD